MLPFTRCGPERRSSSLSPKLRQRNPKAAAAKRPALPDPCFLLSGVIGWAAGRLVAAQQQGGGEPGGRTLFPQVRFTVLHGADAHVSGGSGRQLIQAALDTSNRHDVQVLRACGNGAPERRSDRVARETATEGRSAARAPPPATASPSVLPGRWPKLAAGAYPSCPRSSSHRSSAYRHPPETCYPQRHPVLRERNAARPHG